MLGAIAIRESGAGAFKIQKGGGGRGWFQIDIKEHPAVTEADALDLAWAADYAAKLLADNKACLAKAEPNLDAAHLLQATAAAYNFGVDDISGNPETIDVKTTGDNYGSNMMNLMDCFR